MRSEGRRTNSGATEKGAPFFVSEPVGGALAHSDECERREGRKAREIARRWGKGAQAGREERSPLANEERPNDSTDTNYVRTRTADIERQPDGLTRFGSAVLGESPTKAGKAEPTMKKHPTHAIERLSE